MASPTHLFRVVNEFVFMLVGALLALFALTGRYLFNPRRPAWIALSVVLILWGLGTWSRARRSRIAVDRLVTKIGGGSLALAGLIMLSLTWAPFRWAGWLLLATGGIFVLRGLVSAAIMVRSA
jgi:sulfite exporter TauE/SafE